MGIGAGFGVVFKGGELTIAVWINASLTITRPIGWETLTNDLRKKSKLKAKLTKRKEKKC